MNTSNTLEPSLAEWALVEWSFLLALVLVATLGIMLAVLQRRAARKAKRRERREAHKKYQRWLRNSGLQPLSPTEDKDAGR